MYGIRHIGDVRGPGPMYIVMFCINDACVCGCAPTIPHTPQLADYFAYCIRSNQPINPPCQTLFLSVLFLFVSFFRLFISFIFLEQFFLPVYDPVMAAVLCQLRNEIIFDKLTVLSENTTRFVHYNNVFEAINCLRGKRII